MTVVRLELTLPDGTWGADVSETHPLTSFRVLAAMPGSKASYQLLSIQGDEVGEAVEALRNHQTVDELDEVQRSDTEVTVRFTATRAPVLEAARESGLPIKLPFHLVDGQTTVELVGSRKHMSAFGRQLVDAGVEYEVDLVTSHRHLDQLLTDVQADLLTEAIERGYYETPRECTLTELADAVGIAKSTCSVTLQRAESSVMKRFAKERSALDGGTIPA